MSTPTRTAAGSFQCPYCPRRVSNVRVAIQNHLAACPQNPNRTGPHPNTYAARGITLRPCVSCGQTPNYIPPRNPGTPPTTAPPPGVPRLQTGTRGRCRRCTDNEQRRELQPPLAPGERPAPAYPRELLLQEVALLVSAGVTDPVLQAERLGMKPLSFRRALQRAAQAARATTQPATAQPTTRHDDHRPEPRP